MTATRRLLLPLVLLAACRATATEPAPDVQWRGYIEALAPLAEQAATLAPGPKDAQWRADLHEFLFSQIAVAYLGRAYNSPDYPEFAPMYNLAFNQGFPNPDDSYYLTPIADDGRYRIAGFRGSVRVVYFQLGGGTIVPYGTGDLGPSKAVYDIDDLHIAKDGAFDVMLSRERPGNWKGDWWPLPQGTTHIVVRQRAYDWLHEVDGRFAIERTDLPAAKPRRNPQQIDANLRAIAEWVKTFYTLSLDGPWVRHLHANGVVNRLQPHDYSQASGLASQSYVEGIFEIGPDEALVVETELPKSCRYWNFQLADEFWRSLDWVHRQTSINGHTAKIDADGKLRFVVSARDPGVANWLDTIDHGTGIVYGRWTNCSSAPTPSVTRVAFADVLKHLPPATARVTPEQRAADIRLRRMGAQLRRRW